MTQQSFDVLIVGGGIMGSSTAYNLIKKDPKLKIAVMERDSSYVRASTTLSMSNIRIQFSLKENVQISQYTYEILQNFENDMEVDDSHPQISFRKDGNLFLINDSGRKYAEEAFNLQKDLGCEVEWWTNKKITDVYPLYCPDGYIGGTFGPNDGQIDAYAFLMGYKKKARSLGVQYIDGTVEAVTTHGKRVTGVRMSSQENYSSGVVVNCAGAWASSIAETAGVKIPVSPVKRQVFVLDTAVKPVGPLPLTILPSGLYFRTETGGYILLGKSMEEDPTGFEFSWDDKRFIENLWFELADFVPQFDRLKLMRGWAGLYAVNTLDQNAILGEWPEIGGLILANGFSGHGLQQAPAVGRYIAELILKVPHELDLSIFSPKRIIENKPISEAGIV